MVEIRDKAKVIVQPPTLDEGHHQTEKPPVFLETPLGPTAVAVPTGGVSSGPTLQALKIQEIKARPTARTRDPQAVVKKMLVAAFQGLDENIASEVLDHCRRRILKGETGLLASELAGMNEIREANLTPDARAVLKRTIHLLRRHGSSGATPDPDPTLLENSAQLPQTVHSLEVEPLRWPFIIEPALSKTVAFVRDHIDQATKKLTAASTPEDALRALHQLEGALESLPQVRSVVCDGFTSVTDALGRDDPPPVGELVEAVYRHLDDNTDPSVRSRIAAALEGLVHFAGAFPDTEIGRLKKDIAQKLVQSPGHTMSSHFVGPENDRVPDQAPGGSVVYLASGPDVMAPLTNWPRADTYHLCDLWTGWGDSPAESVDLVEARLAGLGRVERTSDGWAALGAAADHDAFSEVLETAHAAGPVVFKVEMETQDGPRTFSVQLHAHDLNSPEHTDALFDKIPKGDLAGGLMSAVACTLPTNVQDRMQDNLRPGGAVVLRGVDLDRSALRPDWEVTPGNFLFRAHDLSSLKEAAPDADFYGQEDVFAHSYLMLTTDSSINS